MSVGEKIANGFVSSLRQLKQDRDKLGSLEKEYARATETAEKLSREGEKLVGDVPIEITSYATTGRSFGLSWLMFNTELIPALQERQSAAKDALKRYDDVISAAERDLKTFNDAKAFASAIWSNKSTSATSPTFPTGGGNGAKGP